MKPEKIHRSAMRVFLEFFLIISTLLPSALHAQTDLFRNLDISWRGGITRPAIAALADILDPAAVYGINLFSPYYDNLTAYTEMDYALLDGPDSPRSIHYVKTGTGLLYQLPFPLAPEFGAGLNAYFIRSRDVRTAGPLLMDKNEMEFGFSPVIDWLVMLHPRVFLQVWLAWDIIFSSPDMAQFYTVCLGAGVRLW